MSDTLTPGVAITYRCGRDATRAPGHPAGRARPVRVAVARRGVGDGRRGAASAPSGARIDKPGQMVADDVVRRRRRRRRSYVSRGGIKLANALDALGVDVAGRRALDVGASTGGFTDVLLQRGAAHVVALDVAYGELHWKLRNDDRVTVIERTNARALAPERPAVRARPVVADVSFISLTKVLPAVLACAAEGFDCLAMVKPQFEVGREHVGKGASCATRRCGARRSTAWPTARARARLRGPRRGRVRPAGAEGQRARPSCGSRAVTVFTHRRVEQTERTASASSSTPRRARPACGCASTPRRPRSTASRPSDVVVTDAEVADDVELCVVLGGDGTILKSLRRYAGTGVPTYARELRRGRLPRDDRPDEVAEGFERALAGEFEVLRLPAIAVSADDRELYAINDVSVHRKAASASPSSPTASAARPSPACAATAWSSPRRPARRATTSPTAGPVMAWGVEGFVVSFIAPHSMTARRWSSRRSDVARGRQPVARRRPGRTSTSTAARRASWPARRSLAVRFVPSGAALAQEPGVVVLPPSAREVRPARRA